MRIWSFGAGKDAEGKTGDGVGILSQVSHRFFSKVCKPLGIRLDGERDYGVGMFLLPQGMAVKRNQAPKILKSLPKRRSGIPGMEKSADPVPKITQQESAECILIKLNRHLSAVKQITRV